MVPVPFRRDSSWALCCSLSTNALTAFKLESSARSSSRGRPPCCFLLDSACSAIACLASRSLCCSPKCSSCLEAASGLSTLTFLSSVDRACQQIHKLIDKMQIFQADTCSNKQSHNISNAVQIERPAAESVARLLCIRHIHAHAPCPEERVVCNGSLNRFVIFRQAETLQSISVQRRRQVLKPSQSMRVHQVQCLM